MSLFGLLGFTSPLVLMGLLSLPVIWWLLRMTPPAPKTVTFPSNKILRQVQNEDPTADKSPWWLTLLRLLAALCLILALAGPVVNPPQIQLKAKGPMVLLIDNDWSAAPSWPQRLVTAGNLITQAESANKRIFLIPTSHEQNADQLKALTAADAKARLENLKPMALKPTRARQLKPLETLLKKEKAVEIFWLKSSTAQLDETNFANDLISKFENNHTISIFEEEPAAKAIALTGQRTKANELTVTLLRPAAPVAQRGEVILFDQKSRPLANQAYLLEENTKSLPLTFKLPSALLNQLDHIKLSAQRSAGATYLMNRVDNWPRIGLISAERDDQSQPLLSPLYYLSRAIDKKGEIITHANLDILAQVNKFKDENPSIIMMSDVGKLNRTAQDGLRSWLKKGGVLVRFSGANVEGGTDKLLPTPLRSGGRTLGGSLSWSTAQGLARFDTNSPFAGLDVPKEIIVKKQVLADPSFLDNSVKIWARLKDGTPLVTAKKIGQGWLVFFHITANADWSNLPLSGLFVQMTERLTQLGSLTGSQKSTQQASGQVDKPQEESAQTNNAANSPLLSPMQILDGFGTLSDPGSTAKPILLKNFASTVPSQTHPPGFYGTNLQKALALNLIKPKEKLYGLAPPKGTFNLYQYRSDAQKNLAPWFFTLCLLLLLLDTAILPMLKGQKNLPDLIRNIFQKPTLKTAKDSALGLLLWFGIACLFSLAFAHTLPAYADEANKATTNKEAKKPKVQKPVSPRDLNTSIETHLAYVITGDPSVDRSSKAGLYGLSTMLKRRTAIEPADPVGVDINKDELAFYPILYWPITRRSNLLRAQTAARISKYLKNGGMIIFDTRTPPYQTGTGPNVSQNLLRLIDQLNLPSLAPAGKNHVLTKSFYLLNRFPGRYNAAELWVEASQQTNQPGRTSTGPVSTVDGVSSIIVTKNDFAGAWAIDQSSRPLYAVTPGGELQREMAYRVGINIVMYALAGNYKADQVHVPALLERLGQ